MNATIGDVAARAGVSVATVSRALRGLPNVAGSTRERVLRAAAELDYVVNPNASRLAAGRNLTVAAVVPHTQGWYFQAVLAGAQSVLEGQGYDMLLYSLPTPAARERFLTLLPFRKRVDGVLLIDIPLTDPEQRMLAGLGTDIVSVGERGAHYPGVSIDNTAAGRTATEYLLDLGHRHVGLIGGLLEDPMRFRVGRDRREGWLRALREHDVAPDPSWEFYGDFRLIDGVHGMDTLFSAHPDLTAVFCMSDEMAIGALRAIKERGLRCPEDVSVVGFDDHEVSSYIGLTTVSQPMHLLGRTAGEILLSLARDEDIGHYPRHLPTSLVVRETAAPLVQHPR
nr:LacI family DNA-binding transcriptional regulator [Euzebya rosea]